MGYMWILFIQLFKEKRTEKEKNSHGSWKKRESMKYKQETSFNEELKKNIYKISCEKEKKKKIRCLSLFWSQPQRQNIFYLFYLIFPVLLIFSVTRFILLIIPIYSQ